MSDLPEAAGPAPGLREKAGQAAARPGVYLMRDAGGRVIYAGKARNLRKRLASYFQHPEGHPDPKTGAMLKAAAALETIVTASEKEALILESNLIKRHRPRYNVVLKDDKRYPVLRVDSAQPYPRLEVVRRIEKDGALYFGPYASAQAVRETLKIVNKTFRLRKCGDREFRARTRPCLHFQMDACPAPCCLPVDPGVYADMLNEVVLFLRGRTPELIRKLRRDMTAAAESEDFERAARLRDKIYALERTLEKQSVVAADFTDRDVIATAGSDALCVVTLMFVRNGYLLGSRHFDFEQPAGGEGAIVSAFVGQYYEKTGFVPREILVPAGLEDRGLLEEMLTQVRGRKVRILQPRRGEKLRLLQMARENAAQALREMTAARSGAEALLERLGRRLGMAGPPRRIECIDNSNIGGRDPVAGLVAFENGHPRKSGYRRYTIRTVAGADDYATMAEVLGRRFAPEAGGDPLPDLLVLDGGKGQLNIALAVLKSLGLEGRVRLLALAKRDEGRGETEDKAYLPGRVNPLALGKDRDLLLLLQRVRDEAHRFALSFHRHRRSRAALASRLDGIPGIGPKRRQALLKRFGGVDAIRSAPLEEIAALPGVGLRAAGAVLEALMEKVGGDPAAQDAPPRETLEGDEVS